jgi:membrane associated rhomboid family serine protease
MRPDRVRISDGFGSKLTLVGKRLLLIYGVIYVLELLFEHWLKIPVVSVLKLYPIKHLDFHVWQLVTHPFIHDPQSPMTFLISCLVFYFFAGPVENAFGPKRFLIFFYLSAVGAALCGFGLSSVVGFNAPFFGMLPSLLSLIVVFGLLSPEATILLMFVLPVKAKYLSYGTVMITFLTFLAKANPHGAYHLGGILFGYLYLRRPGNLVDPELIYLKYRAWQLKRRRSRFKVVERYKDKEDKDTPTYH